MLWGGDELSMINFRHCDSLASTHLLTVVQSAAWNWSTMVNSAGSMYQMLAKMKEMMERLATLHTNPISTSSSQAVKLFHCAAQNSLHPFLWNMKILIWNNVSFNTQAAKYSLFTKVAGKWRVKIILRKKSLIIFHIFRQFNVWRRQEKYQDLWCRIHLTWSDGSVRVYRTWRANKIFWRKSLKDDVF